MDDNPLNHEVIQEILTHWGVYSRAVSSGEDALIALRTAYASEEPFDAVMIDYQMPEMNGLQLGSEVKNDPLLQETSMILLTPFRELNISEIVTTLGFASLLVKPIRQSRLFNVLLNLWGSTLVSESMTGPHYPFSHPRRFYEEPLNQRDLQQLRGSCHVLLVEDNQVNRQVASNMLERLGCSVDVAEDGREALDLLEQCAYDLVFMDCQMPRMNGYEATQAIRDKEHSRSNRLPIVAITANAMKGDRERCLKIGMDDYIAKPVRFNDLKAVVSKWGNPMMGMP